MLEQLGNKFRVKKDKCGDLIINLNKHAGWDRSWVYEYDKNAVVLHVEGVGRPVQAFKAIQKRWPQLQEHQMYDGEFTAIFPFSTLKELSKFLTNIGAQRYVVLSDEEKARRAANMQKVRSHIGKCQ